MNDEIKETLEHLKEYLQSKINNGEHKIFYNDLMWDIKTIDCINAIDDSLDYITNLQQERDFYKHICLRYGRKGYEELYQEKEDYKSRCEKASEYLKNCEIVDKDKRYPLLEEQFGEDLLNILQNGSEKDEQ